MSELNGYELVNARLAKLASLGSLPPEALGEIGNIAKSEMQQNFRAGGRPTPWKPSIRAQVFGGQTLRKSGALMNSLTVSHDQTSVTISSNLVYARIHALGGVIRAKSAEFLSFRVARGLKMMSSSGKALKTPKKEYGYARVKQVTIPQRDYRYISPAGASAITMAAARRLVMFGTE